MSVGFLEGDLSVTDHFIVFHNETETEALFINKSKNTTHYNMMLLGENFSFDALENNFYNCEFPGINSLIFRNGIYNFTNSCIYVNEFIVHNYVTIYVKNKSNITANSVSFDEYADIIGETEDLDEGDFICDENPFANGNFDQIIQFFPLNITPYIYSSRKRYFIVLMQLISSKR